jgi:hypothetical protein
VRRILHDQNASLPRQEGELIVEVRHGKDILLQHIAASDTIASLKVKVQAAEGTPVIVQRLLFNGVRLVSFETVSESGISFGDSLDLFLEQSAGMLHPISGRADYASLSKVRANLTVFPQNTSSGSEALLTMPITGSTTGREVLHALAKGPADAKLSALVDELGAADVDSMSEEELRSFVQWAQTRAVECGSKRQRPE